MRSILLGTPPPENAVGNRIAFKTGTSYGYRDAWAVGFDGKRTIGVWVGRPDGAPVPGLIGRAVAAPILFDAFARSGKALAPLPQAPRSALIATNSRLPLPLRRFHQQAVLRRNAFEDWVRRRGRGRAEERRIGRLRWRPLSVFANRCG